MTRDFNITPNNCRVSFGGNVFFGRVSVVTLESFKGSVGTSLIRNDRHKCLHEKPFYFYLLTINRVPF